MTEHRFSPSALKPPVAVIEVIERLKLAGHSAYVTGGAIRDMVIGDRVRGDWDVATSALPREVQTVFCRTIPTGLAHGTVTVLSGGMSIEVTTYRHDGPYLDGRRPQFVEYLPDISGDLARRDFTVNAMAYDPTTGEFVDPFGGRDDVARKVIRTVGAPRDRFYEDRLRMLRAVRFAASLGFTVDSDTLAAICELAPGIAMVSTERITDELMKVICGPRPAAGFEMLKKTGLLAWVVPELDAVDDGAFSWALAVCREVGRHECAPCAPSGHECRLGPVRLAALLVAVPPDQVHGILGRMRLSKALVRRVEVLLANNALLGRSPVPSDVELRRVASRAGRSHFPDLVELAAASIRAGGGPESCERAEQLAASAERMLGSGAPLSIGELAIRGGEIMEAAATRPGPEVRRILNELLAMVIEDPSLNVRDRLLALAAQMRRE